jgi:hypothetical protein
MGQDKATREAYYQRILTQCLIRHKVSKKKTYIIKEQPKVIDWEKLENHLKQNK